MPKAMIVSLATRLRIAADYVDGIPYRTIMKTYGIPTSEHINRIARRAGIPLRGDKVGKKLAAYYGARGRPKKLQQENTDAN